VNNTEPGTANATANRREESLDDIHLMNIDLKGFKDRDYD